jgi:hypothetical protein
MTKWCYFNFKKGEIIERILVVFTVTSRITKRNELIPILSGYGMGNAVLIIASNKILKKGCEIYG